MPMSGPMTSPEFSVVATTRRVWSEAEKLQIMDEASAPGANISAVARRHGVAQSLLYRWRKAAVEPLKATAPSFVHVALPAPENSSPARKPAAPPSSSIEIQLTSGRVVRVSATVDAAALKRIIDLLEV